MQTIREARQLPAALIALRAGAKSLALVPTMGALHAGHLTLVEEAKRRADRVAATIFVNPLQFGANEDFGRYPRQEEKDAEALAEVGCDLLWLPQPEEMYPASFATNVSVKGLGDRWEGEARPGHFDGVATVVAKLLCAIRPDIAVFGQKDAQQCAVIERMVRDLAGPVEIVRGPIVREADGLALSSRNIYLSPADRAAAPLIHASLQAALRAFQGGERDARALKAIGRGVLEADQRFTVQYWDVREAQSLATIDTRPATGALLAVAACLGTTRLIDNILLPPEDRQTR